MSEHVQYVTFGVADDLFAAPVDRVREILDLTTISRLPRSAPELLGMIDVRGQSVPVIDLRALLLLPQIESSADTRIVVMTARHDGAELTIGLKTDRVYEVTELDGDTLEAPPAIGANCNGGTIHGIGRRNGAFVTVLDLDRLFSDVNISSPPGAPIAA